VLLPVSGEACDINLSYLQKAEALYLPVLYLFVWGKVSISPCLRNCNVATQLLAYDSIAAHLRLDISKYLSSCHTDLMMLD